MTPADPKLITGTSSPSGDSARGCTTAPRGKCHLETNDCDAGIAWVVSRKYLGWQFNGYASKTLTGSSSPSNGLGSPFMSTPGSSDPGTELSDNDWKSSTKL
uniref:Uncharacterized protein n=1 Tax=Arundo donax TaxID=35708 RepID=A0A0A8XUL3_ARUDO